MNRRIVLIDQTETPDYLSYFGCGLNDKEIYTLQYLDSLTPEKKLECLSLGEGDGAMLVGAEPFKYLQDFYHYSIRSENYFDCSKLRRLSIEGGAFVKEVLELPDSSVISDFMGPDFARHRDFGWFRQKVLHTYEEAMKFIRYLSALPMDTYYGFDYEGSGMALDKVYELSGVSLCTVQFGGFISLTDLRHNCTKEQYDTVLQSLREFLSARMDHLWVFNMQYEFQVSHRILGVDLYDLCDASVFNILDGNHLKKYSLKWTSNMISQATVWDTEFDRISDLIDRMLFETIGKTKKSQEKVLKVTKNNFKSTPEWAELCSRYPKYIEEFERLILEYWGNPYMCIPSEILGYYCNLDAFYTLMLYMDRKDVYSKKAIDTFLDNIRLATRLHSCGVPKWEEYRQDYEKYCKEQMAWGITYCATARCKIKMDKHSAKMANIRKYSPVAIKLLKSGNFFGGDSLAITKHILSTHVDHLDATETGLDEGGLAMDYGMEFAGEFLSIVKSGMVEVKMKGKIDDGIVRKKKILGIISEKLIPLLGLDKIKLDTRHIELEKYLYYERAYNELQRVSKTQLFDIQKIPEKIIAFGKEFDLLEYSDFVSNNYFKCKSPVENDEICLEFSELYKTQSSFLAAILESTQQLPGAEKFYENLGITTINDAYNHFMGEWKKVVQGVARIGETPYPEKMYDLATTYYNNLSADNVKEVWSNFNGYIAQEQFFKSVSSEYKEYSKPFNESVDLGNDFFFMRKLVLSYLMYKKYAKILSTYICGMFTQTDMWVIEDPESHVMIREADPGEPGAVVRMRPKFQCMEKSSKRWSSGYHTIISHSDIKSVIRSYPGHLLTYFDISSAEVKSAGFASGDPDLIDKFVNGVDIYVYTAKIYLGEHFDTLGEKDKKAWRKRFKTIFLGILYGLGKRSLAERLNCSEEEAERIIEAVYNAFPKLREYVATQQKYPFEHGGCVNTFFGDRLQVDEWKYYLKARTERERKNLVARIERLGVNLPIQGGTSSAMSSGFFNDLRVARQEGWNLTSFITVHDSNTCNLPADKVWEIRKFYDHNFTDFCYDKTGIKLLFDLEVGSTYNDSCSMKSISDDIVEFKGNARSILMIMDRMDECAGLRYETSIPRSEVIPNFITNPMERFIIEKGCSFVMDNSKYVVQFKKLG